MFQMMGVFAEFERSMIQERVRAGLARAKDEGKQLGRPRMRAVEERIREALKGGGSVRKVADRFDVSPGTVQRISRPFEPSVGVAYAGIVSGDEKKATEDSGAKSTRVESKQVARSNYRTPGGEAVTQ
jgi:resolvase-like protein